MEDRLADRREKLAAVDERIESLLASDEERRAETAKTIWNDEREILNNFEKYYFSKKRECDRKLKESSNEHLLTFVDDSSKSSSPKHRNEKKRDGKYREKVR